MMSSVAAMLASTAGWRYGIPVTSTPTRSRWVAWASAVVVTQPSRQGPVESEMDRIEVVERPGRLEQLDLVGGLPDGQHVRPRRVLRGGLQGEAHRGIVPQPPPH